MHEICRAEDKFARILEARFRKRIGQGEEVDVDQFVKDQFLLNNFSAVMRERLTRIVQKGKGIEHGK